MIIITATGRVKPGHKAEFLQMAKPLVAASQAETGNISYELCESLSDPDEIMFMETWKDQAAIEFHGQTEHYTTILPKLGALLDGPIKISKHKLAF